MSLRIPIALALLLACTSAARPPQVPGAPLFDCNHNGIEDSVDIAYGSSADADQNGVPDECQDRGGAVAGL